MTFGRRLVLAMWFTCSRRHRVLCGVCWFNSCKSKDNRSIETAVVLETSWGYLRTPDDYTYFDHDDDHAAADDDDDDDDDYDDDDDHGDDDDDDDDDHDNGDADDHDGDDDDDADDEDDDNDEDDEYDEDDEEKDDDGGDDDDAMAWASHDMTSHAMIRQHITWHILTWYDGMKVICMTWHDMTWHDVTWLRWIMMVVLGARPSYHPHAVSSTP